MGLLSKTPDDVDLTVIEDNINRRIRNQIFPDLFSCVDDLNDIKIPDPNKIYLCNCKEYIYVESEWRFIGFLTGY